MTPAALQKDLQAALMLSVDEATRELASWE